MEENRWENEGALFSQPKQDTPSTEETQEFSGMRLMAAATHFCQAKMAVVAVFRQIP